MSEIEKIDERGFTKEAEAAGWLEHKVIFAIRGAPDRLYIKNGRHIFIEWKADGKEPTRQQEKRAQEIRDHGGEAYWVDNIEDARVILGI